MNRADVFRERYRVDWERMVRHPFVLDLGRGSLPREVFEAYMVQDYLFIDSLMRLVASGVAKAPNLQEAKPLGSFLGVLLGAEDDLFKTVFESLGREWPMRHRPEPLPAIRRFGGFLLELADRGGFEAIATALYVTEGTYSDWARRLANEGMVPEDPLYKGWIDIHAVPTLAEFAVYCAEHMGEADGTPYEDELERVFHHALRYEIVFWDAVYPGKASQA